eukprot:TRINITY_DN46470_c0_g1_i1.p1 TRINITY_DN46470_c0_g1~~TRINITY_DN46470_c0_g1_i1.p1  ORF type:complete len:748 (+),score=161.55 TRINITY_DN46470_c0_g1_i1:76-2319(+)
MEVGARWLRRRARLRRALRQCRRGAAVDLGGGLLGRVEDHPVRVHGNRRHPKGASCVACVTDGLAAASQHEIAMLAEAPLPAAAAGRSGGTEFPALWAAVARHAAEASARGAFLRPGDCFDVAPDGSVTPLGCSGDGPRRGVVLLPSPGHDEYWQGEAFSLVGGPPVVLAAVLGEAEREVVGACGGVSRVLAAQRGHWLYSPGLLWVPHARLDPSADLSEVGPDEGGDLAAHWDLAGIEPTPPPAGSLGSLSLLRGPSLRLNGAVASQLGTMLTLSVPRGVGEQAAAAIMEFAASRDRTHCLALFADFPGAAAGCGTSLVLPPGGCGTLGVTLSDPLLLPTVPSQGRNAMQRPHFSGSGVCLGWFGDEVHVSPLAAVDQRRVAMADADACVVSLAAPDMWRVDLRQRSWLRLVEAVERGEDLVVPAAEASPGTGCGGVHFALRWVGAPLGGELWAEQARISRAAHAALREAGLRRIRPQSTGLEDDAAPADPPGAVLGEEESAGRRVLHVMSDGRGGVAGGAANMSSGERHKLRIAGAGRLVDAPLASLTAPMTSSQLLRYEQELRAYEGAADGVASAAAARAHALEANVVRCVFTQPEEAQQGPLEQQLQQSEHAWDLYRQRLVSAAMLHLEAAGQQVNPREGADLRPNLVLRGLCPADQGEGAAAGFVIGVAARDGLLSKEAADALAGALAADPSLTDCPLGTSFDLFIAVCHRGALARARRLRREWEQLRRRVPGGATSDSVPQ